ncbi:MAG: bifunctional nuclease family protein [Thermodesulfobacteriota bacterium]
MALIMRVAAIQIHPETNTPVVWLKEIDGQAVLPIWIGVLEATAIATQLEQVAFPRPMTHDLLRNVLVALGATVTQIEITELRDNTFYALIDLVTAGGRRLRVDARPSDAIALALRCQVPILVDEGVPAALGADKAEADEAGEGDDKRWRELLAKLPPDFGKYKM